jgi:hypothetical protein
MRISVYRINGRSNKARARARAERVAWALVDDDMDLGEYADAFWTISGDGYAKTHRAGRNVFLHHVVIGRRPRLDVCHLNGDKLDCRRENLKHGTRSENMLTAADGPTAANTSGFRGVTRDDRDRVLARPWRGKVQIAGRTHQTRRYATAADAAGALNRLRRSLGVTEDERVQEFPA